MADELDGGEAERTQERAGANDADLVRTRVFACDSPSARLVFMIAVEEEMKWR
jgi:hypothetical protein